MPMLASAEESQLVSGLRPVRSGGVRVERQDDGELIIVHNYGIIFASFLAGVDLNNSITVGRIAHSRHSTAK